jgi:hypothetical protein
MRCSFAPCLKSIQKDKSISFIRISSGLWNCQRTWFAVFVANDAGGRFGF